MASGAIMIEIVLNVIGIRGAIVGSLMAAETIAGGILIPGRMTLLTAYAYMSPHEGKLGLAMVKCRWLPSAH